MMSRGLDLFLGLLFLGMTSSGQAAGRPPEPCASEAASVEAFVLEESARSRIVMFGGQHGTFRADKDFLAALLPELRRQGYTYLALEFEKNPREDSLHEAVQDYALGKVSREDMHPMWVGREKIDCAGTFDLIDTARRLDMKVVFYDADEDAYKYWAEREEIAFNNLQELVFKKDPSARVVILCGALHLNERPYQDVSLDFRKEAPRQVPYLGCYLNMDSKERILTVSLLGDPVSQTLVPYCDLVVDLQKQTCHRNSAPEDGGCPPTPLPGSSD